MSPVFPTGPGLMRKPLQPHCKTVERTWTFRDLSSTYPSDHPKHEETPQDPFVSGLSGDLDRSTSPTCTSHEERELRYLSRHPEDRSLLTGRFTGVRFSRNLPRGLLETRLSDLPRSVGPTDLCWKEGSNPST